MKKITYLAIISLFFACQNNSEEKHQKINEYKEEIKKLESKIQDLETSLNDSISDYKTEKNVLVKVKQIKLENFKHTFKASGSVEANKNILLSPEMNGQIKNIFVKKGESVKKDQVLMTLNTNLIESGIREVETSLDLATLLYTKQKELWDQKIGSEIQYLQAKNQKETLENKLKTLKTQMEMSILKAPFDGIIDEINVKEGEIASPGLPAIRLVNLDFIEINAAISEFYLPYLSLGDTAIIEVPSFNNLNFKTIIKRIGNFINPDNRTFQIGFELKNPNNKLKPNLLAVIELTDYKSNKAVLAPSSIIKKDNIKGEYLYVINNNIAEKRYVKTGISNEENTLILDGLKENEIIVIEGYNKLTNGTSVIIE